MRDGEIVFDGPASQATDAKLSEIYGTEILHEEARQIQDPSQEIPDEDLDTLIL